MEHCSIAEWSEVTRLCVASNYNVMAVILDSHFESSNGSSFTADVTAQTQGLGQAHRLPWTQMTRQSRVTLGGPPIVSALYFECFVSWLLELSVGYQSCSVSVQVEASLHYFLLVDLCILWCYLIGKLLMDYLTPHWMQLFYVWWLYIIIILNYQAAWDNSV